MPWARGDAVQVAFGIGDGPRQGALAPVTAAVQEASDAAEHVTERNAWREHVGEFPEPDMFYARIQYRGERSTDQAAVKNQTAFPHGENLPEWVPGEFFVAISRHVQRARADNGPHDEPGADVQNLIRGNALAQPAPAGGPQAGDESDGHHHAVPADGDG